MNDVHIDELVLRIPGLSAAEARTLGERVAERVGEQLAAIGGSRNLHALDLRLTMPAGRQRTDAIIDHIADAIVARLG
jgi:hypothetical protein